MQRLPKNCAGATGVGGMTSEVTAVNSFRYLTLWRPKIKSVNEQLFAHMTERLLLAARPEWV